MRGKFKIRLTEDYSPITTKEDRHDKPVAKLGQEKQMEVEK